jgi:hypothetical protein
MWGRKDVEVKLPVVAMLPYPLDQASFDKHSSMIACCNMMPTPCERKLLNDATLDKLYPSWRFHREINLDPVSNKPTQTEVVALAKRMARMPKDEANDLFVAFVRTFATETSNCK